MSRERLESRGLSREKNERSRIASESMHTSCCICMLFFLYNRCPCYSTGAGPENEKGLSTGASECWLKDLSTTQVTASAVATQVAVPAAITTVPSVYTSAGDSGLAKEFEVSRWLKYH